MTQYLARRADIFLLADGLKLDSDHLLRLTEAAELLGFATHCAANFERTMRSLDVALDGFEIRSHASHGVLGDGDLVTGDDPIRGWVGPRDAPSLHGAWLRPPQDFRTTLREALLGVFDLYPVEHHDSLRQVLLPDLV